jgi:hypothetical protein
MTSPRMEGTARSVNDSAHAISAATLDSGHWQVPNNTHGISYKQGYRKCMWQPCDHAFHVIRTSTARTFLLFSVIEF